MGDGEPKIENDDPMDIEYTQGDGDEEGDDGRGQSVMSRSM